VLFCSGLKSRHLVKKIYTIIFILISLSLAGIIIIQFLWIKNVRNVQEDRLKEKIDKAVEIVGEELKEYKGSLSGSNKVGTGGSMLDNYSIDFLRKSVTVSQRFTVSDLEKKMKAALKQVRLEDTPFEFGLASFSLRSNAVGQLERNSRNFAKVFQDSVNNYISPPQLIITPSGSPAENLSPDETFIVVIPNFKKLVYKSLSWSIIMAVFFTIVIITAFYLTVRTMLRQKKLSEIKNDFINNMTHEFKTPIATISLAVDALRNEKVMSDREKMGYFNSIIKEENQRMNRQVETILKASQLEKQEVELLLKPQHVHEVIKDVADNFTLQLNEKNGKVELDLNAKEDLIEADEVHFSNLVNNLIDNAVKYAKDNVPPEIKISTQSNGKHFIFQIDDNGIGMSKETLKRIFEKFYRAHTGNIHNVKGFGLGLSYVKTMVEAHGGEIKADSVPGRGSTFVIELPLKKATA
jgi:two-component system phosphate regulon sensor histidine kinase PhoR